MCKYYIFDKTKNATEHYADSDWVTELILFLIWICKSYTFSTDFVYIDS